MDISVIIPTYKPQLYLWECLYSLKQQTFPKNKFEVIIILNGCNEPYYTDIDNFIKYNLSELLIQFIHTEQASVSYARNLALSKSNGEYITFIDDDDYVSPKFLELLYKEASSNTVALCYPYAFNDGGEKKQLSYRITQEYNKNIKGHDLSINQTRRFYSGPCMKLIHRDIINDKSFDCRFKNGEDSIFMFLISNNIKYSRLTSSDAIYYRRCRLNSANLSKRSRLSIIHNSLRMILQYINIYFRAPFEYNLLFFLTRILASLKTMITPISKMI